MPLESHVLVLVLVTLVPLFDIWDARRLRRGGGSREQTYLTLIVMLTALTSAVLWVEPLGELLDAPGTPWLSSTASVLLTAGMMMVLLWPVVAASVHAPTREKVTAASAGVAHLMPRTPRETSLFAALSLTAGTCEELIFRAFLIVYLTAQPFNMTTPLAVAAAAFAFGLAHAGQGSKGVAVSTAAGLVFSGLYYATGTLLAPVVVHVVVDLRVVLFARVVRRANAAPAPPSGCLR